MNATSATLALVAAWVLCGAIVGASLHRRGHRLATLVTALAAWPVLLPALVEGLGEERGGPPGKLNLHALAARPTGPFATRINACFVALYNALTDPSAQGIVATEEVDALRDALLRADARIGMVDRLLGEESLHAVTLAGDTLPMNERMRDLALRVRALEELSLA